MKVVILYRPNSEFSRKVEEYAHEFERTKGKTIELLSLDTPEGTAMARLYDVTAYPAVMALRDDGQMMNYWQGSELPLMSEVAPYFSM